MQEFIQNLIDLLNNNLDLSNDVICGELDESDSIALQIATSAELNQFIDRTKRYNLSILILAKSKNQLTAINDLMSISNYLNDLSNFENSTEINWANSSCSLPEFVDRQDNNAFIYSIISENTITI